MAAQPKSNKGKTVLWILLAVILVAAIVAAVVLIPKGNAGTMPSVVTVDDKVLFSYEDSNDGKTLTVRDYIDDFQSEDERVKEYLETLYWYPFLNGEDKNQQALTALNCNADNTALNGVAIISLSDAVRNGELTKLVLTDNGSTTEWTFRTGERETVSNGYNKNTGRTTKLTVTLNENGQIQKYSSSNGDSVTFLYENGVLHNIKCTNRKVDFSTLSVSDDGEITYTTSTVKHNDCTDSCMNLLYYKDGKLDKTTAMIGSEDDTSGIKTEAKYSYNGNGTCKKITLESRGASASSIRKVWEDASVSVDTPLSYDDLFSSIGDTVNDLKTKHEYTIEFNY